MAKDKSTTCPLPPTPYSVVGSDHRAFQIISLISLALTVMISAILILLHIMRYSVPKEQRQIVKIAMTPVISVIIAFCSLLSYNVAQYIEPIDDIYEAFALAALFLLFVQFSVPSGTFGPELFDSMTKAAAVEGGPRWAKMKWILVFQFPMIQPLLLIITDASLSTNDFCSSSLSPRYANIWVTVLRTLSTLLAVLALFNLYSSTKPLLAPRRAFSKLLCFKIIVGVNVLQSWLFKILVQHNVLKPSSHLSYADLLYGIPAVLVSVESVLFAASFHYAYSASEYAHKPVVMTAPRALANALNPMDLLKGMARAVQIVLHGRDDTGYAGMDDEAVRPFGARSGPAYRMPVSPQQSHLASPPLYEDTAYWSPRSEDGHLATKAIHTRDRSLSDSRRSPSPAM